jgi:hypothetical protein
MIKSAAQSSLLNDTRYTSMSAGVVPSSEYLIASTVLTQNEPSITFDNLAEFAGVYKHLKLVTVSRNAASTASVTGVRLRFNGETSGANYRSHILYATGSGSPLSLYQSSVSGILAGLTNGNTGPTGAFAVAECEILDAFNTNKNTVTRSLTGSSVDGNYRVDMHSSLWINTASINSILVFNDSELAFITGSRFSLYGVV